MGITNATALQRVYNVITNAVEVANDGGRDKGVLIGLCGATHQTGNPCFDSANGSAANCSMTGGSGQCKALYIGHCSAVCDD